MFNCRGTIISSVFLAFSGSQQHSVRYLHALFGTGGRQGSLHRTRVWRRVEGFHLGGIVSLKRNAAGLTTVFTAYP